MNRRQRTLAAAILLAGAASGEALLAQQINLQPRPAGSQTARNGATPTHAEGGDARVERDAASDQQDINIRYAAAYAKLAKMDLQKALDSNDRIPNSIPVVEVERLRQIAKLAEEQLRQAQGGHENNMNAQQAEANAKVLIANYQKAMAANQQSRGVVNDAELEHLRLSAEVAQLAYLKQRAAVESHDSLADLRKELDQLRDAVKQLKSQVESLAPRK